MTEPTLAPAPATPARRTPHAPDLAALHAWLAPRLPQWPARPEDLQLERLGGGQSNPSWRLRAGGGADAPAWVLRARPGPAATLLPSAHAIDREFRVLQALHGSAVPVPQPLLYCEDESVIGAAFYLMSHVEGRILRDPALPGLAPAERAALHDEANRVIAALHQIDWAGCGLQDYGRHDGYFERLIARWSRQYRASLTAGPIEAMERLIEWLPAHLPAATPVVLTHGDYRLENLIVHPSEPRVLAVLDWELSTLGDALSDLAYHCMAWHLPGGGLLRGFAGADLAGLGIPSQRAYIERYLARCGRSAEWAQVEAEWPFRLACNFFRLAAILQGIARRSADGIASNAQARELAALAGPVAQWGWEIASGQRPAL